jgi:phosphate transport system substrate-binding protein
MKNMFFKLLSLVTAGMLALTACGNPATATPAVPAGASTSQPLSGTISISGAFALYPMMTVWASEFQKIHPGVQFDVQAGGAGKGMTDALSGAVDIGMVSRAIQPAEEAKGAYWVPVAKDAVFPVISAKNPVLADLMAKGISKDAFKKIFITGEITTWGQVIGKPDVTDAIHVYTRSDSAGAADMWAQFCGGKAQADILKTAIGVNGEPALVDTVIKDPLGISYSNLNSVFDVTSGNIVVGAAVPPIDISGTGQITPDEVYKTTTDAANAVSTGKYPSPPARFENLVTKGKPTGLVQAFLLWILTDGQKDLSQAGYVPLTPDQQAAALAKVK